MTTRLKGFVVTFEKEMREDDAEALRSAIALFRHVASVQPVEDMMDDMMNREMVRVEMKTKLFKALEGK